MNLHFDIFIEAAKAVAASRQLDWPIALDENGLAHKSQGWDLTRISGDSPPPTYRLRNLGTDVQTLKVLQQNARSLNRWNLQSRPLSTAWQDLIKAAVVDQLLIRRNTPPHVAECARALRVLGTCADKHEPWELNVDDVALAFDTAKLVQPSGMLATRVYSAVANIIDLNRLAGATPLSRSLTRNKEYLGKRANFVKSAEELRSDLNERKHAEKLPEPRAFWELVRIIFTEKPRTFMDAASFAVIRVILLTGLRCGEAVLLPADWRRFRDYYDHKGRPAGQLGGYSRSLLLRHFAEKNRTTDADSVAHFETTQDVPRVFEQILTETLEGVAKLTTPLRQTLRRQIETGRIFPQFSKRDLVPAVEMYTHLTGNPVLLDTLQRSQKSVDQYLTNSTTLDELQNVQLELIRDRLPTKKRLASAVYVFMRRFGAPFRTVDGSLCTKSWHGWHSLYFRVGELEEYLASDRTTKLSDTTALKLSAGELPAWELMFLVPKRALSEGRNDGLCDITRYHAVGRMDTTMIGNCLRSSHGRTLFSEYGETEEDKRLSLNPHSLRHLQTAELLRLGVADTIVTKRFNRRSVAETYVYDHRSLAEDLANVDLPDSEIAIRMSTRTSTIARLIKAGKVSGPIVENFRRIQADEGEAAAFNFLGAEADGFHATPYGYCINSFTIDPCPKHLECFAGCRHLTATNLPEHTRNLVQIAGQLESAVRVIEARPSKSIGRVNQLQHARLRLDGVRKLLAAPTGSQVFPLGPDLSSLPSPQRSVLDAGE